MDTYAVYQSKSKWICMPIPDIQDLDEKAIEALIAAGPETVGTGNTSSEALMDLLELLEKPTNQRVRVLTISFELGDFQN